MADTTVIKIIMILSIFLVDCRTEDEKVVSRDPSNLKLLFRYYPPYSSEPYTYPGPSPSVSFNSRIPSPYPYVSPRPPMEIQPLPKWCENMWQRDECGMKCWMLRKICYNIVKQSDMIEPNDSDTSQTVSYPFIKPLYYPKKTVSYRKTGVANTYYAQPSMYYPPQPYKRYPVGYYRRSPSRPEYGLNPQFSFIDEDKFGPPSSTTTLAPETNDNKTNQESTTENSVQDSTTTEPPNKTSHRKKIIRLKGPFGVKVTYPEDSEVATLPPSMFDYDQYSSKKYYGDRIYMSTVLPVSDRRLHDDFSDFDELDDLLMTVD